MTKQATQPAEDLIYQPADVGTLVVKAVQERRDNPGAGIRSYIANLDKHLLPLRPGELVTVMGRPSNYKSGFMQFWARQVAEGIRKEDGLNEMVVFVTWEMAVEEIGLYDLAASAALDASEIYQGRVSDETWERLQVAAMDRAAVPLWIVGHSIERRHRRPDLTLSNVARALQWFDEQGHKPRVIFLDYLQQMQSEKGQDRRMQVFENVRRCKDMALALGCPVVLGVQAGRQVDERAWKMPGMADGLESSSIEHASDKIIGLWYPRITDPIGSIISVGAKSLEVTDNLLLAAIVKQRMGPANKLAVLRVDPARNNIQSMDVRHDG